MNVRVSPRGPTARAAATALTVLLGTAGCTGESSQISWPDDPPHDEVTLGVPSSTLSAEELAVSDEILSVVHRYRQAELAAFAAPPTPPAAREVFSDVLADPLLTETLATISTMREGGVVFEGRPSWAPAVADLRLDAEPPTATVEDCVHADTWRPVFAESGEPVPGEGRPDRFSAQLELKRYPSGWLIYEVRLGEADWCVNG